MEEPDLTTTEYMLGWMYVYHIQNGGLLHLGYVDSPAYWHPDCVSEWEKVLYEANA